jgi:energy-coupling factor transporter ATP-binding protein EcfA2
VSLTRVGDSDRFDGDRPVHRPHYDVFLSYNFDDGPMVRNVARRLREAGVTVWFAEDSMPSGVDWQDELSQQLMDCGSCAVFVGPTEVVGWERNEMMVAVDRATKDHEFAVFPVVLPGIDYFDPAPLPRFLALKHWVDLRAGPESATAIQELVNAIYRIPPRHPTVDRDATECPYRGLAVFEEKHARFFFGREAEVQRLSENLRRDRFVAVVGQSGVGKSSLVQAGLLPALRRGAVPGSEQWRVLLLRPGAEPAAALAARMLALQPGPGMQGTIDRLLADDRTLHRAATLALVDEPAGSGLLVIVDQFEEIFTLCRNPVEREAFVANLHHAATVSHGDTVVVLVLRADFYPRLTEFPEFAQLVQARHMLIARMSNADLRAAILEPAYEVGLGVEQGLTATILDDVEHEPGALPLLAHALLETWRHRHGGMLTVAGYQEGGGVQHGLGERAEAEYGALSDAAKAEARNIFLRLVEPGQGTADTRRRVALSEVMTGGDEPSAEVIRRFTDAWLLTTSRDDVTGESQIEISHEAVIIAWTRCARWVDDNRADLLVHRRLTVAAQEWKRRGRSPDVLYRGVPLAEAMGWRARSPMRLNWLEGDFLDAAEAQTRAQRRARRLRYTAVFAALATALVTITVVAVVAVVQRNIATSRQLAAEATKALNVDPALSLTLALRAETAAQTAQADEALRQATAESHGRAVLANPGGSVYSVRLLLDGRHAVTGSDDGAVRIWDLPPRRRGRPRRARCSSARRSGPARRRRRRGRRRGRRAR